MIDEWPQLWNVLEGRYVLVGPRPAVPVEVDLYQTMAAPTASHAAGPYLVMGIGGRDALDFESWMQLDMQYIDQLVLAFDWKIILRTIPRVVTGKGAN